MSLNLDDALRRYLMECSSRVFHQPNSLTGGMQLEFWAIPKEIMSMTDLSLEARMVYGILFTRINGDNEAWPGQRYIADVLGCSERSVRRHLDTLIVKSLITVKRMGLKRTNRYSLTGQIGRSRPDSRVLSRPDSRVLSYSKRSGVRDHRKPEGASLSKADQEALGFTLTN